MPKNSEIHSILQSADANTLLILDIDSTLLHTHQRNQAIVEDFCKDMADFFPEDIPKIRGIECKANDYGYYSGLKRLAVSFSDSSLEGDLQYYWRRRFFSSDYLHHDTPYPGAVDFVRAVQQKNVSFTYLTGRYKRPMLSGTMKSFKTLGFPFVEEQLILKEDPKEKDEDYKSREVGKLVDQFEQIILIDNEPVILNRVAQDFPDVQLVWFDSTHSGRQEPPKNIPVISNFL